MAKLVEQVIVNTIEEFRNEIVDLMYLDESVANGCVIWDGPVEDERPVFYLSKSFCIGARGAIHVLRTKKIESDMDFRMTCKNLSCVNPQHFVMSATTNKWNNSKVTTVAASSKIVPMSTATTKERQETIPLLEAQAKTVTEVLEGELEEKKSIAIRV